MSAAEIYSTVKNKLGRKNQRRPNGKKNNNLKITNVTLSRCCRIFVNTVIEKKKNWNAYRNENLVEYAVVFWNYNIVFGHILEIIQVNETMKRPHETFFKEKFYTSSNNQIIVTGFHE